MRKSSAPNLNLHDKVKSRNTVGNFQFKVENLRDIRDNVNESLTSSEPVGYGCLF